MAKFCVDRAWLVGAARAGHSDELRPDWLPVQRYLHLADQLFIKASGARKCQPVLNVRGSGAGGWSADVLSSRPYSRPDLLRLASVNRGGPQADLNADSKADISETLSQRLANLFAFDRVADVAWIIVVDTQRDMFVHAPKFRAK
ncbi:hypothetical protein D3C80_1430650 [compost metagenome]